MQTFKAFCKILKKNSMGLLIYLGIFIVLILATTASSSDSGSSSFSNERIGFTVIDKDKSTLSKSIVTYLSKDNDYKAYDNDMDAIKNGMFYRDIYYALVIPEHFEEDMKNGKHPKTESMKLSDSAPAYYMDRKIDGYLTILNTYLSSGSNLTDSIKKTSDSFDKTVKVTMLDQLKNGEKTEDNTQSFASFYNILPYILCSIIITGVGPALIVFGKKQLKNRISISAQTFFSQNMQLALGIGLFSLGAVLVFNLIAGVLYQKDLTLTAFGLYLVNTLCFGVCSIGIAYMGGTIFRKNDSITGFSVIVPLAISFLGGVFVPVSVLGDGMKMVAKLTPSYWYLQANDIITTSGETFTEQLKQMSQGCCIQLLFALALFCIGLIAAKKRQEG